jgi:hypothetical protein
MVINWSQCRDSWLSMNWAVLASSATLILVVMPTLSGCDFVRTEDAKRLACIKEAADAPTSEGVAQKRYLCLLEYPLKPCQRIDGSYDTSRIGCFIPDAVQ